MTLSTCSRSSVSVLDTYRRLYGSSKPALSVEPLEHTLFDEKGLFVSVVRIDQIHPYISGNKWFKLKYNLKELIECEAERVISFGGAYSNHLHALAYACHRLGLPSVGVVRGEAVNNPMLADASAWGMELHFVDRASYRLRTESHWLNELKAHVGGGFIVPEGGSNKLAVKGVAELMETLSQQDPKLDYLICACGTGGTLAGLVSGANRTIVQGIPVLKQGAFIREDVAALLRDYICGEAVVSPWELDLQGHYGGYGKIKSDHLVIMKRLEAEFSLSLDPVYTSKMFRRFMEKVRADEYPVGSRIALLHTGGLQGRRSIS